MDIREKYINFFQSRGHKVYDSMPLVPDDASLLFTNAGMVQFKDIFTGKIPTPIPPTATSSQLCIRAGGKHNDLENVGYTARHHTLFEMLGNFSFGDYFKKEAIAHAWEFVTNILGFDKSVLYVTIHESDDEAYDLWCKHIDPSRIKRMGDKDNFWQMGDTGPCGPCSEIYVDQGSEFFHSEEDYFGGEGDRFLEIWNLVFMQYEQKDGARTPLPKPSIDTGMGLERVMALKEGRINNFDSSLFQSIMKRIEEITGRVYVRDDELLKKHLACDAISADSESRVAEIKKIQASFRVIADHARSVAFLLAQGVNFDKDGRGYVLRRILRRAVRHGYLLGLRKAFLYEVVEAVCESMGGHYGYLLERKNAIQEQCRAEEERFFETIGLGMDLFNTELEKLRHSALSEKSGSASLDNPQSKALAEASLETSGTILECEDSKQAESKAKNTKSKNAQQLTQSAKAVENHKAAVLVNTRIVGSEIQDSKTDLEFSLSDSNAQKHPHNAQDSKVFTSQAKSLENQSAEAVEMKNRGFQCGGKGVTSKVMTKADNAESAIFRSNATRFTFSGEVAFKLYDTYGFPLDLTQDMLREYGIELDIAGFEACMQEQKNRGKASWKGSGDALKNGDFNALVSEFGANNFVGYECVEAQSRVLALLDSNFNRIDSLSSGGEGWVMLEATPFYPESGGPVGDKGALLALNSSLGNHSHNPSDSASLRRMSNTPHSQGGVIAQSNTANTRIVGENLDSKAKSEFTHLDSHSVIASVAKQSTQSASIKETTQIAKVLDTQKFFTLNLSQIMACQPIKVGDTIMASVDFRARNEISKHHSATHLLHYALRQILGKHIAQAGSLVESHRLRFDFSHNKPIQLEELEQIEALVNEKIIENSTQICEFMDMDSAKKKGAMALFSEKYGDVVRVISFGDSIELCGGIHVKNTAEIGSFYIVKESGVSSGVRRIEAVCGSAAYNYGKNALDSIHRVKEELKAQDIHAAITRLKSQLAEAKQKTSKSAYSLAFEEVGGIRLIVLDLGECEASEAKELVDRAKNEVQKVAVLLLTQKGEKVAITAGVKGIAGLKASTWVKEVAKSLGGNGGGRDDFASAGGKITESNSLSQAIELAKAIAKKAIAF